LTIDPENSKTILATGSII